MGSSKKELIEELRSEGITDEKVLDAFDKVDRTLFVPDALKIHAYKNSALPIGFGQTISQPYTVAFMTQALSIKKDDKVLEIGTGSGFQAAILTAMGAKVFTIERNLEIYNRTLLLFDKLPFRIMMRYGDGTIGWNEFAPYDKIIVTAGGPAVPENLRKQLKVGGRMVIPIGDKEKQSMVIIDKTDEDKFETTEVPNFSFVPLIGKEGWSGE